MTWQGWMQIAVFCALITATVYLLGGYMARLATGETRLPFPLAAVERLLYRVAGVDPTKEQSWVAYAFAVLWFHVAGIAVLYLLQRVQGVLPLNPQAFDAVAPDLALNTAVSFATNTSWQSYAGETTLSHLTQMAGSPFSPSSPGPLVLPLPLRWCAVSPAAHRRPSAISGSI